MLDPKEHTTPYKKVYKLTGTCGYIVWRLGTGESIELLQLAASRLREGLGTELIQLMLTKLKDHPSCHSVYGFTRERMIHAQLFYIAMGFRLRRIPNHYREGGAIMFYQSLSTLLALHEIK